MTDNFPLLPNKRNAVCGDVRKVLRETFREIPLLPPVAGDIVRNKEKIDDDSDSNIWIKGLAEEYTEIRDHEKELQYEYAKRLAREPLPNIYALHSPCSSKEETSWRKKIGALRRKDLKPTVEQNSNCNQSLWVQNILNKSSGDFHDLQLKEFPKSRHEFDKPLPPRDETSSQSISIGQTIGRVPPPPILMSPSPPVPAYIVCIPAEVEIVNFTVGQLHTQSLRLINISKQEVCVSIPPPPRQDLRLELCSRLTITSGSTSHIKLHFTPQSVREVTEELLVRVSVGSSLKIPIRCYMEPPLLEILLPQLTDPTNPEISVNKLDQGVLDLGARLLGDVHRSPLVLRCSAPHASFLILSEDSWLDAVVKVITDLKQDSVFGVSTDCFYITPARWSGSTHGSVCCRVSALGTHIAALRVISSTAIIRSLHLIADGLAFSPKHVTIEAYEKDYDICSEGDPQCEYYVQLGTAFPQHSLAATVQIINHSPISYFYCWRARKWNKEVIKMNSINQVDIMDEEDNHLNSAATKPDIGKKQVQEHATGTEERVTVNIMSGVLSPRSTTVAVINVHDVGSEFGIQKAALMLILKDIPVESFPHDYHPTIVETNIEHEESIPGVCLSWTREVNSVICSQMEVWWKVVPIRFILEPPFIKLHCSRKIKSVKIPTRATLLHGASNIKAKWDTQNQLLQEMILCPRIAVKTKLFLPLENGTHPNTNIMRLSSEAGDWSATSRIESFFNTRCPTIRPAFTWLGIVTPNACIDAKLFLHNNTLRHIHWQAKCYRWYQSSTTKTCESYVCDLCQRGTCGCTALVPSRGELDDGECVRLRYNVDAPDIEGCLITLIQVNTIDDIERSTTAALVACRVLAPRLVLRVLPCYGDKKRECEGCTLASGVDDKGTAILRPSACLCVNERSCYRIQIENITPLSTNVTWDYFENEKTLKVTFIPKESKLHGYSKVNVMVVLECLRVCERRLFVRQATVAHSKPLYLLIDAAISGVEVAIEFPIGGDEHTHSSVIIKMSQREESSRNLRKENPTHIADMFAEEDLKREKQKHIICFCKYEIMYIPPQKKPQPPLGPEEYPPVEIVESPPLTRVCRCTTISKPLLPEDTEPYCLQFKRLPLNIVRSRTLLLRNESRVEAEWCCTVRRWPRECTRSIDMRQRARSSGVSLQCCPIRGVLRPRTSTHITVSVFADTWGIYYDQILIQVENLEPLVLDVWIEAVGMPLQFALRPNPDANEAAVLWVSSSDPKRGVRVLNTSRAELNIYTYIVQDNEYAQDELPFRLYLRLYDILPPTCPCLHAFDSDSSEVKSTKSSNSCFEEMDTALELFLGPDYGREEYSCYRVDPVAIQVKAGATTEFEVQLFNTEIVPHCTLLLRSVPVRIWGEYWYRPLPIVQLVHLSHAPRRSRLEASREEIRVIVCALDLPHDDVMRVRKHFKLRNTDSGALDIHVVTSRPWRVEMAQNVCNLHCIPLERGNHDTRIHLPPHSSSELFAEVSVATKDVCPIASHYPPTFIKTDEMRFLDADNILLLEIPLILELDQPILKLQPPVIDFGSVSVGCIKKSYFTMSHSSLTTTVQLIVKNDEDDLRIHPQMFSLPPREKKLVYVEYTARWFSGSKFTTQVHIQAVGEGRSWCSTTLQVTRRPQRCAGRPLLLHSDHTDDTDLVPADVRQILQM